MRSCFGPSSWYRASRLRLERRLPLMLSDSDGRCLVTDGSDSDDRKPIDHVMRCDKLRRRAEQARKRFLRAYHTWLLTCPPVKQAYPLWDVEFRAGYEAFEVAPSTLEPAYIYTKQPRFTVGLGYPMWQGRITTGIGNDPWRASGSHVLEGGPPHRFG